MADLKVKTVQDFQRYIKKEILPASKELQKIRDEKSRKHLQKLAYTNIVNRFDSMIDEAILDNCRSPYLVDIATSNMGSSVSESDLIKLLLKGNHIEDAIEEKLKDSLRAGLLRDRHARKLSRLFELFKVKETWNHPRVNISTGHILGHMTPKNKQIPYSICGYADWLYSRRNSIVHGAGTTHFLENDLNQLKKLFNCVPAKTVIIKMRTINIASEFYDKVACLLNESV